MPDHPTVQKSGITLLHVIIFVMSMMVTLAAWQFSKGQMKSQISQRFEASRNQTLTLIRDRMTKYEDALWAGVAAVESHDGQISYPKWHSFARTLRIDTRYPGINGIGVIHFHTSTSLDGYMRDQMSERPDFRVFPQHDEQTFMPITYIKPEESNAAAIGLDVAHEQNRRTAALLSRDTGLAQITGPIILVHDAGVSVLCALLRGRAPLDGGTAPRAVRGGGLGALCRAQAGGGAAGP
jgi:CHASE1-domain containing sensor protein